MVIPSGVYKTTSYFLKNAIDPGLSERDKTILKANKICFLLYTLGLYF